SRKPTPPHLRTVLHHERGARDRRGLVGFRRCGAEAQRKHSLEEFYRALARNDIFGVPAVLVLHVAQSALGCDSLHPHRRGRRTALWRLTLPPVLRDTHPPNAAWRPARAR